MRGFCAIMSFTSPFTQGVRMWIRKYVGDRRFYRNVLAVSLPIMIQSGITNFVGLLDNVMVGRLGTEAMSGVSIVNQFLFIFQLVIFGAISAAGIFTAQYHGLGDREGVQHTFRFKLLINVIATAVCVVTFLLLDDQLISLFLHNESASGDLSLTLHHGKQYLAIMLIGLLPYSLSQAYASTMRETRETVVPMLASVLAVGLNFLLNLLLIFGYLGFPALGVVGAAVATVISRFAELSVLLLWGHTHRARCPYLVGAFRSFRLPRILFLRIITKGLPLMANELFWSLAITMRNQCYSTRGLDVVAAQNINATIVNVFNVVYMAVGSSIAIVIGNLLGAGKIEEAKDTDRKMMVFSVLCATLMGGLLISFSHLFPQIYNTGDHVRSLAAYMMIVSAITMPFCAFSHSAYFTLRSGGKVLITLLFDSVYMWSVVVPISAVFAYVTNVNIYVLFAVCQATEVLKVIFGVVLLRRGSWLKQLV